MNWQRYLLCLVPGVLGCTSVIVDLRPSDCVNPKLGQCVSNADSRVMLIRLYQLKDKLDPCKVDVGEIDTKDLDALKGVVVTGQRTDEVRWEIKVEPRDSKSLPAWPLHKDTHYLLAVALGHGRGKNSVRLLPVSHNGRTYHLPLMHFRNYDICLKYPCEVNSVEECP